MQLWPVAQSDYLHLSRQCCMLARSSIKVFKQDRCSATPTNIATGSLVTSTINALCYLPTIHTNITKTFSLKKNVKQTAPYQEVTRFISPFCSVILKPTAILRKNCLVWSYVTQVEPMRLHHNRDHWITAREVTLLYFHQSMAHPSDSCNLHFQTRRIFAIKSPHGASSTTSTPRSALASRSWSCFPLSNCCTRASSVLYVFNFWVQISVVSTKGT